MIGDEEFVVKPLTGKAMFALADAGQDKAKVMEAMVLCTLQGNDASITAEDIADIPFGDMGKLIEAIVEVNDMK